MVEKIPLVYLWIYKKMVDKFGKENQIIFSKNMLEIIRRALQQVPRKYDYFILKEMMHYGLIDKINSQKYKLLGSRADQKLKALDDYFFW